jgi:ABC-type nitrate/sulfonate/bicarbonate transport system permease component
VRQRISVLAVAVLLAVWEIVGRLPSSHGVFPAISAVLAQMWADRALYPPNSAVTLVNAALGFLAGNAVAVLLAIVFDRVPVLGRLGRGPLLTVYCLPLIVLAPIVGVSFGGGDTPKVVLAALAVVFPTYVSTTIGLRSAPAALRDVVRALGGGRWTELRLVQIRACVPDLLAGLRVAAPAAVLGAMLGEFLGGSKGLGVLLVATMPQAFPERLWGVGLFATAVAALSYAVFAVLGRIAATGAQSPTVGVGALPPADRGRVPRPVWTLASVVVVLAAWEGYLKVTGLPSTFAKGPDDVWRYLVDGPKAAEHRAAFAEALQSTLPRAGAGLVVGLSLAFGLAVVLSVSPAWSSALLPVALVSQSMPLVALTPLLVVTLGRTDLTVLAVTASVTFFPSFVTVAQGLAATPRAATDVVAVYAAPRRVVLWKVAMPSAVPHLVESARLAIPRALLGVIIAEYLALGTGVGALILEARGKLEFSLLWSVAAVVTVISVLAYAAVGGLERLLHRRFGIGAR